MTEQYDPKLVEVVDEIVVEALAQQQAYADGHTKAEPDSETVSQRILAAIDASSIAFVAPSELTPALAKRGAAMVLDTQMASGHPERGGAFNDFELPMAVAWRSVRDACLAERRGEGR